MVCFILTDGIGTSTWTKQGGLSSPFVEHVNGGKRRSPTQSWRCNPRVVPAGEKPSKGRHAIKQKPKKQKCLESLRAMEFWSYLLTVGCEGEHTW